MSSLAEVVRGLAERDGVDAVVVASDDGLPIDQVSHGGLDAEALAALAAVVAQQADRLGAAAQRGELATAVLEYGGGLAVIATVGTGNRLLVLARADADIGPLLYDLRRHRPALAALL